jgi:hypothetical protein
MARRAVVEGWIGKLIPDAPMGSNILIVRLERELNCKVGKGVFLME